MRLAKLILFLIGAAPCFGQGYNLLGINPNSALTDTGQLQFWDKTKAHNVTFSAPLTIPANKRFFLPSADGTTAGDCLTTDAAAKLAFSAFPCATLGDNQTFTGINTFNTATVRSLTIDSTGTSPVLIQSTGTSPQIALTIGGPGVGGAFLNGVLGLVGNGSPPTGIIIGPDLAHMQPFTDGSRNTTVNNLTILGTCSGCGGSGGLPVVDTTIITKNFTDNTKLMRFDNSLISPASTRILTIQDASYTLAGLETNQVFSGINNFRQPDGANGLGFLTSEVHASDPGSFAGFLARFSRGTNAAPSMPIAGDRIGFVGFGYFNGTDYNSVQASVQGFVEGSPAAGSSLPSTLQFATTNAGQTTSTVKMALHHDGTLTPGTDNTQDIGDATTPTRWRTGYFHNIDAAALSDLSSYVKTRYLYVADNAGGPANWRMSAQSGFSTSEFYLADQSGIPMLTISRLIATSPVTFAKIDSDWDPTLNNTYTLGTPTLRWNANIHNLNVDGSITGVGFDCSQGTATTSGPICFANLGNTGGNQMTLGTRDNFGLVIITNNTGAARIFNNQTISFGTLNPVPTGFTVQTFGSHIVTQAGQATNAFNPTGALGGIVYANDTGTANTNGGGFMVGSSQGPFFIMKGLLNGTGTGPTGDLSFEGRATTSATSFSEIARISATTNTLYANNANFAPVSGSLITSRLTTVQELVFADRNGSNSANWILDAASGLTTSTLCLKDQSGNCVLQMDRLLAGSAITNSIVDSHWLPKLDATYDLGSPALRWRTLYLSNPIASSSGIIPYFSITAYGAVCDGTSHTIASLHPSWTLADATIAFPYVNNVAVSSGVLALTDQVDWAAIMQTVGYAKTNSVAGTTGGIITFPRGRCMVNKTIDLGDGSAGSSSTYHSIILQGQGMGVSRPSAGGIQGSGNDHGTEIQYNGSSSTSAALVKINGPVGGMRLRDMAIDCNDLCGYGVLNSHGFNGGSDNLTIRKPLTFGIRISINTAVTYGSGPNNNNWVHTNIKPITNCAGGGVKIDFGASRNNFYGLDIVGTPPGSPGCLGGPPSMTGSGMLLQVDSMSVYDLYELYMGHSITFQPTAGDCVTTGCSAHPTQIDFHSVMVSSAPVVDNSLSSWGQFDNSGIIFENYIEDGGGPTFPQIAGVRGYTAAGWWFGNPKFLTHGVAAGIETTTTLENWKLGTGNGAAIEFRANDGTANTSTIDPPNNVFSAGRIYGSFTGTGYANSKVCIQNATALNTYVDALCVKNGITTFTGTPLFSGNLSLDRATRTDTSKLVYTVGGSNSVNGAWTAGIEANGTQSQYEIAHVPVGDLMVMHENGDTLWLTAGAVTQMQLIYNTTTTQSDLGVRGHISSVQFLENGPALWNGYDSTGGSRLGLSQFIGFAAPFDPNTNPFSTAGQLANVNWNVVQIQKDGNSSFFVADTYGNGTGVGGTNPIPGMKFRAARGSVAAPAPLIALDFIASIGGHGANNSNVTSGTLFPIAASPAILFQATEDFNATHGGTRMLFSTTPNGSTTRRTVATFDQDGTAIFPFNATIGGSLTVTGPLTAGSISFTNLNVPGYVSAQQFQANILALWNNFDSIGGAHLGLSEFINFNPPFDPNTNPYSTAGQLASPGNTWMVVQVQSQTQAGFVADTYGVNTVPIVKFRQARGSIAAPSGVLANDTLGTITAHGGINAGVTTGTIFTPSGNAAMVFQAAENFDATHNGTAILFQTTPLGATARASVLSLNNTAIIANEQIVPFTSNSYALGTSSFVWSNVFSNASTVGAGGITLSGNISLGNNEVYSIGTVGTHLASVNSATITAMTTAGHIFAQMGGGGMSTFDASNNVTFSANNLGAFVTNGTTFHLDRATRTTGHQIQWTVGSSSSVSGAWTVGVESNGTAGHTGESQFEFGHSATGGDKLVIWEDGSVNYYNAAGGKVAQMDVPNGNFTVTGRLGANSTLGAAGTVTVNVTCGAGSGVLTYNGGVFTGKTGSC